MKGVSGNKTIVSRRSNAALVSSSNVGYQSLGCKFDVIQIVVAFSTTAEPLISTKTGYLSNQRRTCDIEIAPRYSSMTT